LLFGVGSAVAWGSGDYAGGLAARRVGGMAVAGGAQLAGLLLLVGAVVVLHPDAPSGSTLLLGALGGIAGGLGLAALYRGLALGAMGLVSAVSGIGAVLISLVVSVLGLGAVLDPLQLAGITCALAAVAAASFSTAHGVDRRAIILALAAALGFGLWFVFLNRAAEHDQLWALVASRGSATIVVGGMALRRIDRSGLRAAAPLIAGAGGLDIAANAMVVLSFATIPLGITAALSGTYPLVTMLLARALLGEALPRLGLVAVGLAVTGVVLISLGS
jgi:drug/metabolite transporter (DMT)-like permease